MYFCADKASRSLEHYEMDFWEKSQSEVIMLHQ